MRLIDWFRRLFNRGSERHVPSDIPLLRGGLLTMARQLNSLGVPHALIGGVAVSARGHVRATRDLDFLIDAAGEERVHHLMESLGFETLQRTEDVSSYLLRGLRVDFLHARREYTREMLKRSTVVRIEGVDLQIATIEDLIGLKVQALANDPSRAQDRTDIEELLRLRADIDMERVREYFRVFDREHELDAILEALAGRDRGDAE